MRIETRGLSSQLEITANQPPPSNRTFRQVLGWLSPPMVPNYPQKHGLRVDFGRDVKPQWCPSAGTRRGCQSRRGPRLCSRQTKENAI